MKARHAEWAKLTAARSTKPKPKPIKAIDLPGFQALEDRILLSSEKAAEDRADALGKQTFGVTKAETDFQFPSRYDDEDAPDAYIEQVNGQYNRHHARFMTTGQPENVVVDILMDLGIDFTGRDGRPLRCTLLLCRQAEAAARKIAGRLPDVAEVATQKWGASLEEQARLFQERKRRQGRPRDRS